MVREYKAFNSFIEQKVWLTEREYNRDNAYTASWWNLKSAIHRPSWTRFQSNYHKDVCGAQEQLVVHAKNRTVKGLIEYNIKVVWTFKLRIDVTGTFLWAEEGKLELEDW